MTTAERNFARFTFHPLRRLAGRGDDSRNRWACGSAAGCAHVTRADARACRGMEAEAQMAHPFLRPFDGPPIY